MAIKYTGLIKSKAQANRLADIIEKSGGDNGMVSMLRNNWQAIATRPGLAAIVMDIAQDSKTAGMSVDREGSVLNRIMKTANG